MLKLAPENLPMVPAPRPKFEIFVYSPRLEAVHLRFGRVARGGLRWSERPEDFRTEVLGLVKAQEVKNSVIVPSGAKGGFVCKRLPAAADREARAAEILACYRMFISAMLDITDNIAGDEVVAPAGVVRLDDDDPYLVVAADKGTATFSDVANEIAGRYGFWLGDAFASGGSEGYDHKKMGITARGAWESVRWHFAALRLNPDVDDFTVAGVGDMSGDVFGNGMLLSRHIKLVAAFDHRHVFLDPDPDPAVSFAERQRLFDLPRSSWADYDLALISAGGGIWPREAKSVPLSAQARAALGIDEGTLALSPDDLISAILKAPVDLLWNGGIGTYVKATHETHADAGDRSNDAVRVDATELRARVVAEGGNLGLTQAARIEYALGGGLVNTDFIDNSAGVDTSDHEVNIKILLSGEIKPGERGELLHAMTDEVAAHVLRHNDGQNMALAVARYQAPRLLHVHARYLRRLVRNKRLSLEGDVLPGDKEIAARRSAGTGLTTPELAILLAQTKIAAGQEVLASDLPNDPYLRTTLVDYFPAPLRARFGEQMSGHRLRREIITTSVVNEMVDTGGSTFLFRMGEETSAPVPDITRAWLVAREVFGMSAFWRQLEELAGEVDVDARIALVLEARKLMERATRWLLVNRRAPFGIAETVGFFAAGVATVRSAIPKLLSGRDLAGYEERRASFAARGVPAALAEEVAAMVPSYSAFDIVTSAAMTGRGVEETAAVYFAVADRLQIGRLRDLIVALPRDDRWSSMARSALRDDLYGAHAALTRDVLAVGGHGEASERVAAWESRNASAVERAARTLGEIWESERFTFTTLSVATRVIRTLVAPGSLSARRDSGAQARRTRSCVRAAADRDDRDLAGARRRVYRGEREQLLGFQARARRALAMRQQRHEVRGDRDRRPRVDGLGLVQRGGDLDGGVQVHRIEHQGATVGRAQRELPVVRPFELPLADVAGRGAQSQQRAAHGAVEAGGQRPAGDHLRGGAGRAVVDHGRLQRARDVGARQQRGVRQPTRSARARCRPSPARAASRRGRAPIRSPAARARWRWPARTGTARGRCLAPSTAPARRPPASAGCAPGPVWAVSTSATNHLG